MKTENISVLIFFIKILISLATLIGGFLYLLFLIGVAAHFRVGATASIGNLMHYLVNVDLLVLCRAIGFKILIVFFMFSLLMKIYPFFYDELEKSNKTKGAFFAVLMGIIYLGCLFSIGWLSKEIIYDVPQLQLFG